MIRSKQLGHERRGKNRIVGGGERERERNSAKYDRQGGGERWRERREKLDSIKCTGGNSAGRKTIYESGNIAKVIGRRPGKLKPLLVRRSLATWRIFRLFTRPNGQARKFVGRPRKPRSKATSR